MWEEGVVRCNTTEARLIDRTTFIICVSWQQIKNAPHRNCNGIAVAAHYRSSPFLQTSASSLSDRNRKTVTIDVTSLLPALLTPAQHRVLRMLLPLILFLLLFDGFELFSNQNIHCGFQPLLLMRIGIITCGVVPDELVPQYGT